MKVFFRLVWKLLQEMFTGKMHNEEKILNESDLLAKYIFKEKELRADGRPRPAGIKPRQGESLSMTEVTELQHNETCEHGHIYVDNPIKNRIHIGYVKFIYESFSGIGLEVIYDNKPPRHVSVVFPNNPERRREAAKALADEAILINENIARKYLAACK